MSSDKIVVEDPSDKLIDYFVGVLNSQASIISLNIKLRPDEVVIGLFQVAEEIAELYKFGEFINKEELDTFRDIAKKRAKETIKKGEESGVFEKIKEQYKKAKELISTSNPTTLKD